MLKKIRSAFRRFFSRRFPTTLTAMSSPRLYSKFLSHDEINDFLEICEEGGYFTDLSTAYDMGGRYINIEDVIERKKDLTLVYKIIQPIKYHF